MSISSNFLDSGAWKFSCGSFKAFVVNDPEIIRSLNCIIFATRLLHFMVYIGLQCCVYVILKRSMPFHEEKNLHNTYKWYLLNSTKRVIFHLCSTTWNLLSFVLVHLRWSMFLSVLFRMLVSNHAIVQMQIQEGIFRCKFFPFPFCGIICHFSKR